MVIHRKKKVGKYRGHTTHGGGHRKKRRGAGSRGGRGRAGSGKRSGHKKNLFSPIGQHGFTSIYQQEERVVNLSYFTPERVPQLLQQGKAKKEGEYIVIDVQQLGYQKVLGTSSPQALHLKLKLIALAWSKQAEERITAAGGVIAKE
jgi:large subunit ribosomal protein L15